MSDDQAAGKVKVPTDPIKLAKVLLALGPMHPLPKEKSIPFFDMRKRIIGTGKIADDLRQAQRLIE